MPTCFLVLLRFWLKIDKVLFKIFDTRIFHNFEKNYILREFQHKESPFESIIQVYIYLNYFI